MDRQTASEDALVAPGIIRMGFFCWIVATTLGCAAIFMKQPFSIRWLRIPGVMLQFLASATKTGLKRRAAVQRLAVLRSEQRQARRLAAGR